MLSVARPLSLGPLDSTPHHGDKGVAQTLGASALKLGG